MSAHLAWDQAAPLFSPERARQHVMRDGYSPENFSPAHARCGALLVEPRPSFVNGERCAACMASFSTVAPFLSDTLRNARLRGDQVVHLDEIESPDRGVLIAHEGRWIWAEYRDGKLRDSATRAPASSVLAFADYAQWREAFGR